MPREPSNRIRAPRQIAALGELGQFAQGVGKSEGTRRDGLTRTQEHREQRVRRPSEREVWPQVHAHNARVAGEILGDRLRRPGGQRREFGMKPARGRHGIPRAVGRPERTMQQRAVDVLEPGKRVPREMLAHHGFDRGRRLTTCERAGEQRGEEREPA